MPIHARKLQPHHACGHWRDSLMIFHTRWFILTPIYISNTTTLSKTHTVIVLLRPKYPVRRHFGKVYLTIPPMKQYMGKQHIRF